MSRAGPAIHRQVVGAVVLCVAVAVAFCCLVKMRDTLAATGTIVADHGMSVIHSTASGLVIRVATSVGDHLAANDVILTLDPNLSPDKLADSERRLSLQQEERDKVQKSLDVVSQITQNANKLRSFSLESLGVSGETFNLLNDVYTARLELDNSADYRRINVAHQKSQLASEIGLTQRNIELLKRNLEVSRKDSAAREASLVAKRNDFAALMKLAEKGLVAGTDVNRERDALLTAEVSTTENHKQVDQVELDISNRTLRISQLKMQTETVEEEANNRYNAAKLRYELAVARLTEHKVNLSHALQINQNNMEDLSSVLKMGLGGQGTVAMKSPVAGILVGLRYPTPGDSVQAGAQIATVQPDGMKPVVLVHIANREVGLVQEGQPARIKIDAYPYFQFGTVSGTVSRIFSEPDRHDFTAKITLNSSTLQVGHKPIVLIPGLAIHADIFTQERRLISLLVHP